MFFFLRCPFIKVMKKIELFQEFLLKLCIHLIARHISRACLRAVSDTCIKACTMQPFKQQCEFRNFRTWHLYNPRALSKYKISMNIKQDFVFPPRQYLSTVYKKLKTNRGLWGNFIEAFS